METNEQILKYITTGSLHKPSQAKAVEIMSNLPKVSLWKYTDKSRSKGDPYSQDAYYIVQPTSKCPELFVSMCDGVTNAFFSEFSAQVVAKTLAKYKIQELEGLLPHTDEMQKAYNELLMADDYVQERLAKDKNNWFANSIETGVGATTLGSVKISPNATKTGLEAKVHMVGNSVFFVLHEDGSYDCVVYSEECLDSSGFSGVDLGKNNYKVYKPEDDDLWEITKTVPLEAGDTCLFTTDGMASGFLDIMKNPQNYIEEGLTLSEKAARLHIIKTQCTDESIGQLRDIFVENELVPEDDVTLIKFDVYNKNSDGIPHLTEGAL